MAFSECDTSSTADIVVWRIEGTVCIYPQMALRENWLINMSVREYYAPERTGVRKTQRSFSISVCRVPVEAVEEDGEEYFVSIAS